MSAQGISRNLVSYGDAGFSRFLRNAFLAAAGYSTDELSRPVIGIADLSSDYNPCHRQMGELVENIKRGVLAAGGIPFVFPTISLGESLLNPTAMLYRNLLAMVTEELSRAAAVCVLPGSHRLARRKVIRPADLRGERFLSFPLDGRMRHLIDAAFEQERIERRLQIDVYSSADACALAARGLGVSIVEPFTARDYMSDGIAVVPFEPRIRYLFRAMRPRYRKPSRLADAFLDAVKTHLKAKGWA